MEQIRQELSNDNSSKQLMINSLYDALRHYQEDNQEEEVPDRKENDISTLDNESDIRSMLSLPSFYSEREFSR